LNLPGVSDEDYFIVIRHRNHLAVMSASAQSLNSSSADLYDFTTSSDNYYGSDAKLLESGKYGMWAGDCDGSGGIGAADRNATWNDRTLIGYKSSDCDLSGAVGASDRNITWNNRTKLTRVPNN
jgi:hypothetical protein